MANITSDTYVPITDDGNYDVINLTPGLTYAIKLWGTWGGGTLVDIKLLMQDGTAVALDDTDAASIDGTGVTEFQVVIPASCTAIRLVASASTGSAPDIDYSVQRTQ